MKILITGGSGYIGRNLKRLLTNKGHHVFTPSHSEINLMDYKKLDEYLRCNQFDAVIHSASKGGKRNGNDTFENTFIPNITMYENLVGCLGWRRTPIIMFGSGAEYDRRHASKSEYASSILFNWPIDPYGLSKNLITRRAITYAPNVWILRLFGCFNYDEDDTRFIKSCITNIKNNKPIIIHQQKIMDFFFLDDIVPVIERIFEDILNTQWPDGCKFPKNLNLTYPQKQGLVGIAQTITQMMNKPDHEIIIEDNHNGFEYTGSDIELSNTGINLCGFREGLRRTISELS